MTDQRQRLDALRRDALEEIKAMESRLHGQVMAIFEQQAASVRSRINLAIQNARVTYNATVEQAEELRSNGHADLADSMEASAEHALSATVDSLEMLFQSYIQSCERLLE